MLRVDRSSPALVALTALLFYAAWVGWAHHIGHDWQDWATIGRRFVSERDEPRDPARCAGRDEPVWYDGQFFLYIARDPAGRPLPRQRELPLRPDCLPARCARTRTRTPRRDSARPVVLNLLAVAVGTWAIAAWLRRERFPEWFALLYAAFPGVFFGVWRDLSEPLAYSLTAVALLAFDGDRPRRIALSLALRRRDPHPGGSRRLRARLGRNARCPGSTPAGGALRDRLAPALSRVPVRVPEPVARERRAPRKLQPTPVPFGGIGHYFPWGGVDCSVSTPYSCPESSASRSPSSPSFGAPEPPPSGHFSRTHSSSWCSCLRRRTRTTPRRAGSRRASSLHSCCRCRPCPECFRRRAHGCGCR